MWDRFSRTGVASFRFDVPERASSVELTATFETENADDLAEQKVLAVSKYTSEGRHLKVWTSSDDLAVGDYAILHFSANFDVDVFYILVSELHDCN